MLEILEYQKDDFKITTDPGKVDIDAVCSLLAGSYWAKFRKRNVIVKSLQNSLCYSLFHQDKQIGIVRVVTDYATFAYFCDFIIGSEYRHKGLGTWMLECLFENPDLKKIKIWFLITKDAHELYRRFKFDNLIHIKKFMIRYNS